MAEADRCSRCGAALATRGSEGASCPRCLLALGLSEGLGAAETAPTLAGASPADLPERIGSFRILDTLGVGDRGVVYLAEREQRVALKVLQSGPDTRDALARFEADRPALARVSHPGLAKVRDAGATEEGWPWFALDWVPGVPITEYCDRERLTVSQRLGLLVEVCEAIQHAHAEGVAHRDIRPSNVRVTEGDDGPRPMVLDLGLARALDQRLTAKSLFTARGLISGTPCYVPPEQTARPGPGSDLDENTRSDVYSLGVLLYELVAGAPPFDARRLRQAGWAEMVRVIREEPPARPSERVAAFDRTRAAEVAAQRRTDPQRLVDELRDGPDWIALRALEKDPLRRYPSAHDMALDIQRHLRDELVAAGPRGLGERLARAMRRALRAPASRGRG